MKELKDLEDSGCFEIVDAKEATRHRIYRHSFVDTVKHDGRRKSRLCVAAFNDKDHGLFTAAPTVKRISIRLMLSICASFKYQLYTRDVKQAFIQSKTKLRRPVYMRAPPEMALPKHQLLKVVRSLYGMPEAPMHWFKTYGDHHREKLAMDPIPFDPCLWYRSKNQTPDGVLSLQVDDTLFGGSPEFLCDEEEASKMFPNSGRTMIGIQRVRFNGLKIRTTTDGIFAEQYYYVKGLREKIGNKSMTFEDFRSLRQKLAYVAYSSMPDILVFCSKMAQYTASMYDIGRNEPLRLFRKAAKIMHNGPSLSGITFSTIAPENMEIVV